jgi:serine/threonine protein kinase/tetratricopeptide (TPR) repeat protein
MSTTHDSPDDLMHHDVIRRLAEDFAQSLRNGGHLNIADVVARVDTSLQGKLREELVGEEFAHRFGDATQNGKLRYRPIALLGKGAFGEVYKAVDEELERNVAFKVLLRTDAAAKQRFLAEARRQAKLPKHNHLVEVYDSGTLPNGHSFAVMQYLDGGTLRTKLDSQRRIDFETAAQLVEQIALAVAAVHKGTSGTKAFPTPPLVHRDLKPENILLDSTGNAHVADFGIAAAVADLHSGAAGAGGTIAYMSPEQATAYRPGITRAPVDTRSDIWALGVILYELLTGQRPFVSHAANARDRPDEILDAITRYEPAQIRDLCPGVPPDLELFVSECLKKDPAERINSAAHMATCLRRWLDSLRDQKTDQPILNMPSTDPTTNRLTFSSRVTRLIGRDAERSRLSEFLDSASTFSWWLMTGPAGSGKSRIALELCHQASPDWHAGFLSRTEKTFKWSQFRPSQKTLIVIDYVASRAAEVGEAVLTLCRASSSFKNPVRVLLVERNKGSWWTIFNREESQSESAEMAACLHHKEPLGLPRLPPKALVQLAEDVVHARNGKWSDARAREFLLRLHQCDSLGRPLFAMILAECLETVEPNAPLPDLLCEVLKKEAARRRNLIPEPDKSQRMENLLLLATMVNGLLPKAHSFGYLAASDVAGLLPDADLLNEALYNDMAGSAAGSASFAALQPDILGERFVLDRVSADGIAGLNARRLLLAAWSFQPRDVAVVTLRSAFDFRGDPGLYKLFGVPLNSSTTRTEWADMVSDLIALTRDVEDPLTQQQLRRLIQLADSHPQEPELQGGAARADYNMGYVYMSHEHDTAMAVKHFDAAIARIGSSSLAGRLAYHNRALLIDPQGEEIIDTSTKVIEDGEAPSEMQACALNNRADIYAERGEHGNAICDRTEVLALKNTSPDRRYIALLRRSRSYCAIGNAGAALDDLGRIQESWDISPPQKAEARLERAVIMRRLERWDEAQADLQAVIDSSYLFTGTRAMALVELAEVSRRKGNHVQADSFLSKAMDDPDAREETLVDAMIVGALLLEDAGNVDGASEMWRNVLGAPTASDDQVRIAQRRLDAISQ